MKTSEMVEAAKRFSKPYRVTEGKKFRLRDVDPRDTGELTSEDKTRAKEALQTGIQALAELQDVLYAQDRWGGIADFPGDGCGGQGWRLQGAELRGSRPRLSLALPWDATGLYQVGSFIGDSWKEWNGRFRDDVRSLLRGEENSVRRFADRLVGSPGILWSRRTRGGAKH